MKLLKNSTYNELKSYEHKFKLLQEEVKWMSANYEQTIDELRTRIRQDSCKFRIQRCIVGKRASGKTSLLQNYIIPRLKNYFVIDLHNEYTEVPAENKITFDKSCSFADIKKDIIKVINGNETKTIIIDNAPAMFMRDELKYILNRSIQFNYIITAQAFSYIAHTHHLFETIYDLGTYDYEICKSKGLLDCEDKIIRLSKEEIYQYAIKNTVNAKATA